MLLLFSWPPVWKRAVGVAFVKVDRFVCVLVYNLVFKVRCGYYIST